MATSQFVRLIGDSCEAALVRHGFRRLRRDGVVLEIAKDFFGWVGLNVGNYGGSVRINPFVGIHCVPLMKLVSELCGEKYQLGRYATFAVHFGEVCPNVEVFDFWPDVDPLPESDRLATCLQEHGVPYMESYASLKALLPVLESRVSLLGGYPERTAVAYFLSGRNEDACRFVQVKQAEYLREDVGIRQNFDRFAIPFLEHVGCA